MSFDENLKLLDTWETEEARCFVDNHFSIEIPGKFEGKVFRSYHNERACISVHFPALFNKVDGGN